MTTRSGGLLHHYAALNLEVQGHGPSEGFWVTANSAVHRHPP